MHKPACSAAGRDWRPWHCLLIVSLSVWAAAAAAAEPDSQIPRTFRHPGLLNSAEELALIKQKIQAGQEPWKTAFQKMHSSRWARLSYTPHPVETPTQDIAGANDQGAFKEIDDAIAAYTHALSWVLTDDPRHAQKAVEILDAWSAVLKSHGGVNWYLHPAWVASVMPQAAELLRATYPAWKPAEIARFSAMLNNVFLPVFHRRMAYGNRELAVCNALAAIGVFNNDRAAFAEGVGHWVSYVPCYFYLAADGPRPRKADYWLREPSDEEYYGLHADLFPRRQNSWLFARHNWPDQHDDKTMLTRQQEQDFDKLWYYPGRYVEGLCGETGRDLAHAELGLAAAVNVAEIAWHQGIDLYSAQARRLTAFMECHSAFRLGKPVPQTLYGGVLKPGDGIWPTFEIAYNHFHNRQGMELPMTAELIAKVIRPMQNVLAPAAPPLLAKRIWAQAYYLADWETLTHADLGGEMPAAPPRPRKHAARSR